MPRRPKYKMFRTNMAGGGRTWAVGKKTKTGGYKQTGYYRIIDGINLGKSVKSKRTRFEKPTALFKRIWG